MILDISEICFDGTFFTVLVQFHQLWTIFIVTDQHVLPAIVLRSKMVFRSEVASGIPRQGG